jgi:hypothetical protein
MEEGAYGGTGGANRHFINFFILKLCFFRKNVSSYEKYILYASLPPCPPTYYPISTSAYYYIYT